MGWRRVRPISPAFPRSSALARGWNAFWGASLLALPRSLESEPYTPHYTVPIFPQCPQENVLPTLPVFQGAAVSRERFSQSLLRNVAVLGGFLPLRRSLEQLDVVSSERNSQFLPPGNEAELRGLPPHRGSLEQLEWPSPAGPPLQGTELAALSTLEASFRRLVPLTEGL